MPELDELYAKICDELHDAGSYAKMALEHRADNPELAQVLHDISQEEMGHFKRLHAEAAKMIGEISKMQDAFNS